MTNFKNILGVEIPVFPITTPTDPKTIVEIMDSIPDLDENGSMYAYNKEFNVEVFPCEDDEIMVRMVPTLANPLRSIYDTKQNIKSFEGNFYMKNHNVEGFELLEKCMRYSVELHASLRKHLL